MMDVSCLSGCMVNLGGFSINFGKIGMGIVRKDDKQVNGVFYYVYWYKYLLIYWLNIIIFVGCLEGGDMDIVYLFEIDLIWVDSSFIIILNLEVILFVNFIVQGVCVVDVMVSVFYMLFDILFWCVGFQGLMYLFSGWVSNEFSLLQFLLFVSECMVYKFYWQG